MQATIEAIRFKDIRGKESLYLKITKDEHEPVIINIGQKTFKAVEQLESKSTTNAMDYTEKIR